MLTKAFIIPVAHICVSFCKLLQFHILFVILFQKAKTIFSVLLSLDLHLVKTYITKITLRIMFAHHNRHKVLFFVIALTVELRSILTEFAVGCSSKTSTIRKITPVSAEDPSTPKPSDVHIQVSLERRGRSRF